ncbi:hypothetical protein ACHAWF_009173 [Thalassiosira exigua]
MKGTQVPSEKVVGMADGAPVPATEQGQLPLPQLKPKAREGDILPGLQNTLVSVGKMADAGYVTIFEPGDKGVAVYNEKDIRIDLSRGWRDHHGLWCIPLPCE